MKKLRTLSVWLFAILLLFSACGTAIPLETPDGAAGNLQQAYDGKNTGTQGGGARSDGGNTFPGASKTDDFISDASVDLEGRGVGATINPEGYGSNASVDSKDRDADASVDLKDHGTDAQDPRSEPDERLPVYGAFYYDLTGVVLYLEVYGELPPNYITKNDARALGWEGGSVEKYKEGAAIGGDFFGNYEGLLPDESGQRYTECDIDTNGYPSRGSRRLVFSNDGRYFYTSDHYESFLEYQVTAEYEVIPCE